VNDVRFWYGANLCSHREQCVVGQPTRCRPCLRTAVGYATARAEEAQKTYERAQALREGVSVTTARVLETQRDARVFAAQLAEARARLALLRAGSREEDIREAEARRDTATAQLEEARAQLDQCSIRAPVDGAVVDVVANPGQFMSLAVPAPLLHMVQDKR